MFILIVLNTQFHCDLVLYESSEDLLNVSNTAFVAVMVTSECQTAF